MSSKSLNELKQWSKQLSSHIGALDDELAPLRTKIQLSKEELELVQGLIRLRESAGLESNADENKRNVNSSLPDSQLTGTLEQEVEKILTASGEPLHISSIAERLRDAGVVIPGKGEEANVIVRLRRLPERFTRTARGVYGVAAWGLKEMPVRKRRSRRRKTKR